MRVLGIDPGTNFGWDYHNDGRAFGGNMKLTTEPCRRMVDFRNQFELLVRASKPEVVGFEYIHPKSAAQAKIIYGQLGIVRSFSSMYSFTVLEVPASQWKKHVLGDGRASKEVAMQTLGCDNEHAADARGVRYFVEERARISND